MDIINFIVNTFSILANQIQIANCLNLQDRNIHLENDFRDLLNLIYDDRTFKNLNEDNLNNTAIDLGDNLNEISIQITSTTSTQKVRDTITKFQGEYKKIIMLYCVIKKPQRTGSFSNLLGSIEFEEWDLTDLSKKIQNLSNEKLDNVYAFIKSKFAIDTIQLSEDVSAVEEWEALEPEDVRNIEDKLKDVCTEIRQSRIIQYCREIASGKIELQYYSERDISAMKFRIFEVCQDELNNIIEKKESPQCTIEEIKSILECYNQRAVQVITSMSTDYNYPIKNETTLRKVVLSLIDECYISFDEKGLYGN